MRRNRRNRSRRRRRTAGRRGRDLCADCRHKEAASTKMQSLAMKLFDEAERQGMMWEEMFEFLEEELMKYHRS